MRFSLSAPPLQTAARWLLATAAPVQEMVGGLAGLTHDFCINQAREVLWNDGYESEARILSYYSRILNEGVAWMDQGWRNTSHYYNPVTYKGLWGWPSAAVEVERYFSRAVHLYRRERTEQAMFFLGAACHLIQDLCVPHHSHAAIFSGHREFESFAEENRNEYRVFSGGIYSKQWKPSRWVIENARISYDFFTSVDGRNTREFDQVLQVVLPVAQRSTAGFFKYFFDCTVMDKNLVKVPTVIQLELQ